MNTLIAAGDLNPLVQDLGVCIVASAVFGVDLPADPAEHDLALRDVGLAIAAFALAALSPRSKAPQQVEVDG